MSSCSDLPSGVMRYSTATGRVLVMTRSTIPLRSRRRSVAVSDFCVTTGDRPAEVVEAQRSLAQGVEDLERPLVEHLVEQLAVLLGELSGFLHDT
jgi:hypothetical protein